MNAKIKVTIEHMFAFRPRYVTLYITGLRYVISTTIWCGRSNTEGKATHALGCLSDCIDIEDIPPHSRDFSHE